MGFCLFELNRVHDLSIGTENSDNIYNDKFMYFFDHKTLNRVIFRIILSQKRSF